MEYYVEYVFAENFIIDFVLLYITGDLLKKKINIKRLAVSALIGAIYVIAIAYFRKEFISRFIVKFSVSVLMVVIAFNPNTIISITRIVLCFYIVTLMMVGVIGGLYYFTGSKATVNLIILSVLVGFAILKIFFYEIKKRKEDSSYLRTVTIEIKDKKKSIKAFIDTGNELKDPMTGKPVIIINIESIKDMLGEDVTKEVLEFYESKGKNYVNLFLDRYEELKLRVLRYNTISQKDELLMCIVPDNMTISYKNKKVIKADAVIGIYPSKINEQNEYDALLFKKLLDWENENEYECEYC